MNETYIEILDENGNLRIVSHDQAIKLSKQRIAREDREIGLHRKQIPVRLITLPEHPESEHFTRLARAIERLSTFSVSAVNPDQALMMRCIRCYWNAKAVSFSNLIYPLIPDPTAEGAIFSETLPRAALEHLRTDLAADKALYDLLHYDFSSSQPSAIRAWLQEQKIDCPFTNHEEYFLKILSIQFQRYCVEPMYVEEIWYSKHEKQRFHSQCLKYLNNLHDPEEKVKAIQESEEALRNSQWEGYALLALRASPKQGTCKVLKQLWKSYLKAQSAEFKCLNSDLHWKNSIPYQRKKTNNAHPLKGVLMDDGHIDWVWG